MSLEIDGRTYVTTAEVLVEIGVTRQTLWRWRREGKIPKGRRFRDRQVIFSAEEMADILNYANRLEPLGGDSDSQSFHQRQLFE